MYYLDKLLTLLTSVKETRPFKFFERLGDYVWYYLWLPLVIIFLAWQGYKYVEFRQSHTLVEATITEHVWKDDILSLRFRYSVDGVSYEGNSENYGKEINHRRRGPGGGIVVDRKSAYAMADECPISSKHKIYYQDNKPEIAQLAY